MSGRFQRGAAGWERRLCAVVGVCAGGRRMGGPRTGVRLSPPAACSAAWGPRGSRPIQCRVGPFPERERGMTRAARRRCGGGESAPGIGACSRQSRRQQSAQERGVFDSLLRVRLRKGRRDSVRASHPKRGARFMPMCGRSSGTRMARRIPAFTSSAPMRVLGITF